MMKRILVIDDDEICRRTIVAVLEQSDYQVMQADNGETGVTQALQDTPDLIVTDVVMPRLDGFGVFDTLRAHPATRSIPFIFTTGFVDKEGARRGPALGGDALLIKPFALTELLASVKECLSKSPEPGAV